MKILSLIVFITVAYAGTGQETRPQISEQMKALNFLHGKWEGKVKYEPGVRVGREVFWTIQAYNNVGGNMLLIDGNGSELTDRNKAIGEVLVVISWDSAAKLYFARLHYASNGSSGSIEAKGHLEGNKLVLETTDPSTATRRYTVRLNDKGQWHELGEVSTGSGESWKRRFEMTLNRQNLP